MKKSLFFSAVIFLSLNVFSQAVTADVEKLFGWDCGESDACRMTVVKVNNGNGIICEFTAKKEVELHWQFGGDSQQEIENNVFSVEGNQFALYYGEFQRLGIISGTFPPQSEIDEYSSPIKGILQAEPGKTYYFAFGRRGATPYYELDSLYQNEKRPEPHTLYPLANTVRGFYNVRDFGAQGDGENIDSYAINNAIECASEDGGGTVFVPAGNYLCYSIRLKSHIRLLLDAGASIIAAFPTRYESYDEAEENDSRFQDFGHSHWKNSLLWAIGEEDITICGSGTIYGRGLTREGNRRVGVGNKAISLKECRNVVLKDFKMLLCGHFALLATGIENLTIDNLLVDTNRDGFDIDCCRNVRISNCTVNTPWDDAIVLKASYGLGYFKDTENVTITSCYVSGYDKGSVYDGTYQLMQNQAPDHDFRTGRIKFGTESSGGFKNIAVTNCIFEHCRGLALETVDGGHLEDVVISNITMRNIVNSPIFLRLGARQRSPQGTPIGKMRRILIDNINVYGADSRFASIVSGIRGNRIEDVTFSNIKIRYKGGYTADDGKIVPPENEKLYPEPSMFGTMPASVFFVRHAQNIKFDNIDVSFEKDDYRPAFVFADTAKITIRNADIALPDSVLLQTEIDKGLELFENLKPSAP